MADDPTPYDSTADTLKHALRVGELMAQLITELTHRSLRHDRSKTEAPELATFNEFTPKLRDSTYGSEEYKGCLASMKVGLDHHYANNRHHPEFFDAGISGMTLVDLIEMLADWRAATERHADGSLVKSLGIQKERFGISDQLAEILWNTAREFWWLDNQPCGAVHRAADGAVMTCNVPIERPEGHDGDHCDGRFEPYTWPREEVAELPATAPAETGGKPDWRERARARVGDQVAARMAELMAEPPMSAEEFDEAMERNRAEAEAHLDQQSRKAFGEPEERSRE